MYHINQDIQTIIRTRLVQSPPSARNCKDGLRLGEQGGDMLSHVHRGEEVARGDYGLHERTPQVRSQVSRCSSTYLPVQDYTVVRTNTSKQTRVPDPVQALGLPL
jgi:hypothetical protein